MTKLKIQMTNKFKIPDLKLIILGNIMRLDRLKTFFSGANGIFKRSSDKVRGIKDFQKDRLVFFGKVYNYRVSLFGMVNFGFGKLKHHDVFFSVITNVHNGSFLLDRR